MIAHVSQWPRALFVCLIASGLALPVLGQKWAIPLEGDEKVEAVPGVVYVRFIDGRTPVGAMRSGFASFDQRTSELRVRSLEPAFPMVGADTAKRPASEAANWLQGVYRLTYDAPIPPVSVARWLARSPDVELAEPQYIYQTTALPARMADPNDPQYSSNQGYLSRLELDDAWDTAKGASGNIVIAIVDEGVETTHPDLAANLWTNPGEIAGNNVDDDNNGYVDDIHGWSFEYGIADVNPEAGDTHGTEVAGIANAVANNSTGIAGAAWNAKTMVVNVGCWGRPGQLCHVVDGIRYAYMNGADVINLSWSGYYNSAVLHQTMEYAEDNGAIVVGAVGNEGQLDDHYIEYSWSFFVSSEYPVVLSVGATAHGSDQVAPRSNYGRTVNVFAPGVDIATTTLGHKYTKSSGTSFSTPLVSGIAALVMTERPNLDPAQVRELIRLTADNIDDANSSDLAGLLGNGRVNAHEALTATLPPAVRLWSYDVKGRKGGDDVLEPEETVAITAGFRNYGANASNLTVGFDDSDPYLEWSTSPTVSVGKLDYGSIYNHRFTFKVAANAPENYRTALYTKITNGTFTDSPDAISLTLNFVRGFVTHETPSIRVSIGRYGNIGHPTYRHQPSCAPGFLHIVLDCSAGFEIKRATNFDDFLNEGGLMLGTSASTLADGVTNANANGQEQDFAIKPGTRQTLITYGWVGSEDGQVTLVESSTSTADLDVEIQANSYTFNETADDDYVILHYTIINTGTSDISDLHAGLYVDLDAGYPHNEDKAQFDSNRRAGYIQRAAADGITVGVRLLSTAGDLHYAALDVEDDIHDGFTDSEKWSLLSGGIGTTMLTDADVGQVIAAGPIDISSGSSAEVAFALVSGGTAAEFLTNSDAAQSQWNSVAGYSITLSTDVTTVSEGDGATTVTVTAATRGGKTFPYTWNLLGTVEGSGTASAVDFTTNVSVFPINIPLGSSGGTGTFTLTPKDDNVDETDETITIGGNTSIVTQNTTITLTDNDATPSGIALTVSPTTVEEDDGATTITLTGRVSGSTLYGVAQKLPIQVSGSGSSNAVDFASVEDFELVVRAARSFNSTTFVLTPVNDQISEVDETITISSTSSVVSNSPTITLTDDDGGGSIDLALSTNPRTVSEGAGVTTITVWASTRNGIAVSSSQSITVTVAGSGTVSAVDFAAVSPFTIDIAAGSASGSTTFSLTPTDDVVDETDETITISSSSALVSQNATITVTDNDAAPAGVTLTVSPMTVGEGDGSTNITLTGTVSGNTTYGAAQTLPIQVSGSGNSRAVDFTAVADFNLVIPAEGATGSATFALVPEDDQTAEVNETVTIRSTSSAVTNTPMISLTDNDGGGNFNLALSPDRATLSEGAGAATITVTAATTDNSQLPNAVSITVTIAGSGSASAVDFASVSPFSIAIASGSSSGTGTFTLTPTDDVVDETDETITITSSSALVSQGATITLADDDATPAGVSFSLNTSTVDEGAGPTTITLTGTVSGSTTYGVAQTLPTYVSGSGNANAVDFTPITDFDLIIPAEGSTNSATFQLVPVDDQMAEADETVTISSPSSLVTNAPTITITDNDGGSAGTLALTASVTTVSESDGATPVTVTATTRDGSALTNAAALTVTVAGSGVASAVDFAVVSPFTIAISSGSSSGTGTFTLTPTDDAVDESTETITISSTSAQVSQGTTITLTDDDDVPAGVSLSVNTSTIDEGDGTTTITLTGTVSGSTTYGVPQTLPIQVTGSGNASTVGFTAVADFNLEIPAEVSTGSTTFELTPEDDQATEASETVTISSTSSLVTNAPTITITDNDGGTTGTLALTADAVTISEGGGATPVTVTAATQDGSALTSAQSITITIAGSGVASAVDFTAVSPFSISIASGSSSGTGSFTLTPTDDAVDEIDETITITSSHALVRQGATLTLTDNDASPAGVMLSVSANTVGEGDGPTTITLTGIVGGSTTYGMSQTLPIRVSGSGNPSVVGFTPVADFDLVIAAEGITGTTTFELTPEDDQTAEADETVTISSTSTLVTNTPTITITDNDRQELALSVHPASVREEMGTTTITVTATAMHGTFSAAQTVPIRVVHPGIDAAVDFSPVSPFSITVEVHANSGTGSFTLTPINDTVDEQDEHIAILSTHPQAPDTAFVTLLDDDATPLGITLAASPSTIYENDGSTQIAVTASVSGETQYADSQKVLISVEGSGVESAVDFDPIADFTVLLPSGVSQGLHTMLLVPTDDLEGESGERITIRSDHPWVLNTAEILLIDDDGGMTGTDADTPAMLEVPVSYPNPATNEVSFVIVAAEHTTDIHLRLYNVLGQPVATPFSGALYAGEHTVRFDASTLPAGVYMYVVTSPAQRHSGRFIVAR